MLRLLALVLPELPRRPSPPRPEDPSSCWTTIRILVDKSGGEAPQSPKARPHNGSLAWLVPPFTLSPTRASLTRTELRCSPKFAVTPSRSPPRKLFSQLAAANAFCLSRV